MLVQVSWLKTRHSVSLYPYLPPSLSVSIFFSLSLADLCISLHCLCLSSLWRSKGRCAHRDEGDSSPISFRQEEGRVPPETSTQLHLRGPCYGRRICSFACKSLPGAIRLPPNTGAQKHWCLINMEGIWTLLCKHVLKTDFLSSCCIYHMCSGAGEHRDDIPWHFMCSMCHKADIKVDIQLTWRWIGCHKHWWHYITNDAKFSWHCCDIEQCRLCNRIRSSFSKRWPKS